ncbi:MAG: peptidyl-dipeptidase Dcp [Acidobacteriota bacterium]|nr:peptidyl-dipeptidase Dcp [Acidobacteriota bacterium]
MNKKISLIALSLAVGACTQMPAPQTPAQGTTPAAGTPSTTSTSTNTTSNTASNPFFTMSNLQYQAPRFDLIRDEQFQPALEEGMRRQIAEMEAIANSAEAPTFVNTIEAMERSGELLTRTAKVFFHLTGANTNDTLQKIEADISPKLAAHQDAIYMNPRLFSRVKALYDRRETLGLDAESKVLLEKTYRNFIRAGAQLSEADKATLRALNQEESSLTTKFRERVLAETTGGAIVVNTREELEGLSEGDIAAAATRAKERGMEGKYVLALQNTTQQPALASLKNRALRQRLFEASVNRGRHGGESDTSQIVQRLAQLRAQRAKLLGYPNYAAYGLEEQMAKNPENALKLLTDLAPGATAKARAEVAKMQQLIDKQGGGFQLAPWDWDFYAEQVRKAEYDLDESQVRPYFELDRVLRDGVFYAANQLYGLTFKERKDLPVYHADVRVFEVFDQDGKSLALFYADYFQRENKGGGAWMDTFVDQSHLLGTHPVVYNVLNVPKPAAGQPALLSFDNVTTMFHEFGHALHGMLSNVKYPTLSGANVPRDFVEFPSQFNEHWALEPKVFANFAKHYQTGEPMSQALVEKIRKSSTFNQGYGTTEYLAAALLDMAWHTLPADTPLQDVQAFQRTALQRFNVAMEQVPPRYGSTYFSHIWGGGYSAGYYAYLWSEVLDHDAYYWFVENGGLSRANGQRFRDMILSRGASIDPAQMYRGFRGRDPRVEPLLKERGLTE